LITKPCTPTELAYIEGKHVSHVSRALSEMRKKGLVEPLPTTTRERYYRVTSQGYAIYATAIRFMK
jgi:DNA-binding MarR family transcriptional regulator